MADIRVPLPSRAEWITADDMAVHATMDSTRYARRFSLDIAEDALREIGPATVRHIAQKLAESVVHRHQSEIENAVHSYLRDRAWAEPIIRKAIEDSVQRFVSDMLEPAAPSVSRRSDVSL